MKLIELSEYINTYYVGNKRPSRRSLKRLINLGRLPGKRLGNSYYIDIEKEKLRSTTGNPLVDRVLYG